MQGDDLDTIAEKHRSCGKKICLRACMSAGCMSSKAAEIKQGLEAAVKAQGLEAEIEVRRVRCVAPAGRGPLVGVDGLGEREVLFEHVTPDDAATIVGATQGRSHGLEVGDPDHPFFAKQMRVVRANGGYIDPERIDPGINRPGQKSEF